MYYIYGFGIPAAAFKSMFFKPDSLLKYYTVISVCSGCIYILMNVILRLREKI